MTVRELIEALGKLPPDLPVVFKDPIMMHRDVTDVVRGRDSRNVHIATLVGKKRQ